MLCAALFLLALLNPSLLHKERDPIEDVALIVIDQSTSQSMGERESRTQEALLHLKETLSARQDLELRVVNAPESKTLTRETRLFDAIERNLADVPQKRRAGVVIISDGQIHDVPAGRLDADTYGPFHLLLTGSRDEKDRRINIVEAPSYGIVGGNITVNYVVEDTDNIRMPTAQVTVNRFDDEPPETFIVPVGEEQTLTLPLTHAGENVFELSVDSVPEEMTTVNNKTALIVNGVRDRLKVLLVSGKPHAGGRTWRDLLTSDPGVDLVHFTILREPEKMDATPQNELALIAFPFRELFEIKLYDFDLIVFDRYRLNRILPDYYFRNIATYVRRGGALLEASGPSFASEDSIYYTDLGEIFPARPNGDIVSRVFKPALSETGLMHPVTQALDFYGGSPEKPGWGSWLRQVSLQKTSGDTLMNGPDDMPLLILDRVEQGRVAQIASDHIWLWSRGYDGGGPHAELLRRVVHWLMKEPELDETALDINVSGETIRVRSRKPDVDSVPLTIVKPDGTEDNIVVTRNERGFLEHSIEADQLGIYRFSSADSARRFAIIGERNPPELQNVLTSDAPMKSLLNSSKGGALWLEQTPRPGVRMLSEASHYDGRNWIGLRDNNAFAVKSVKSLPFLPAYAWLIILAAAMVATWWYEGRRQ